MAQEREQAEGRPRGSAETAGSTRAAQAGPPQASGREGSRQVGAARREPWLPSQPRGPFTFIRRIAEEMDRLFEELGMPAPARGGFGGRERGGGWQPHVEACVRGGNFVVRVDLPGLERNEVDVQIEDDVLVVTGERRREEAQEEGEYWATELEYGRFERHIPLPEGADREAARATFRNGVLMIEVPTKSPERRGRRIEIRDGGGAEAAGQETERRSP
jgi:HSP20 family protein